MRSSLAVAFALLPLLIAGSTAAQNRAVRPYFLVIVDTSGSMGWCSGGDTNTDCTCHVGSSCGNAFNTNRCGLPSNRIGDARCALQRIIDGTGDAVFGLMQFRHNCSGTCAPDSTLDTTLNCEAQLVTEIKEGNASLMREWVDGNCTGTCTNNFTHELTPGGYTPLAQSLRRAQEYLRGTVMLGSTWPYPTNPAGTNMAPPSPVVDGLELGCRPVSVILLTDGADTCEANDGSRMTVPPMIAAQLMVGDLKASSRAGKAFKTYVIGYGAGASDPNGYDPTVLENIAMQGGTSHYFPASNEAQLSAALTQIVADAQPPVEICNNRDDDCDMLVDEGIPKFCDKPHGINDNVLCAPPAETVCDGIDDNCNGIIDEGVKNACGTCGDVPVEVCDNMDNDCDGTIDEDIAGGACGKDVGICKPGNMRCIAGMNECTGGVGPQPETCNCKDDDCDTFVDEDPDNTLCPGGKCIGCVCVPHCGMDQEFMASCPDGQRADFQPSGECFCVKDECNAKECSASTLMRDDEVACAPGDPKVAPCLCRVGMCVARCDGVSCAAGQICNKRNGRCVENNCHGLGCASGELCDPVSVECKKDPCIDAGCKPTEVCRDGTCETSCAGIRCDDGQRCQAGSCATDTCYTVSCPDGKGCNPATGKCVENTCAGVTCGEGLTCSLRTGDCERDPCFGVHCPGQQSCTNGECISTTVRPGTTTPSHGIGSDPNARVIAAGGGGCSCRVGGGGGGATRRGQLACSLCLLFALLLGRRRRAKRASWLAGGLLCAVWPISGCRVEPFCIDCASRGGHVTPGEDSGPGNSSDGSLGDGGSQGDASADAAMDGGDDAAIDSGTGNRCKDPMPETCNGKDDDCDFKVDEDTVAAVNDCDQSGICAGTKPICLNGAFTCRYPDAREQEETLCDGKDNDCDGRVDETFAMLDAACDIGTGACKVTGKQICNMAGDALICVATTTIAPADEICDGIDNDCDGMVDEPRSNPGTAPSFVTDEVVQAGANLWVYKYEAARPDATSASQGIIGTRACSHAGVLPWTNLTYSEALAACQAADMDLCQSCAVGDGSAGDDDHCTGNDWRSICEGSGTCAWSYTPSGGACPSGSSASYPASGACNGHDQSATPGGADNDALAVTGASARCFTHVQGGDVFDMSGNAKEWTKGPHSPNSNPLRGGSYNNLPGGMRCDFNFNVAADNVRLPNVGFRCCSTTQP